ncbi:hypothetical protein [Algoriphagus sp. NG3]|uniref:hypothetical protein n=1 Tax=Algoriphagus sp. NG3 TaxID=3097546 RepID=UPI002A7F9BC8|nr:hypothetical protein [Algoriphagus sp. NG3]WPR75091.1 hypothetical protein SLW71_20730 [Algoriphagus sp. NG3]
MNKGLTLLSIVVFIFQGVESFGQSQTYLSLYRDQLPYFQELITGAHYEDPPNSYVGHPYLLGRDFQDGILTINNVSYTDVPLLYNMHEDELVTFHPIYQEKIWIKPEKVEAFQFVEGELFQRFSENETYPHHKNGFYEVVSDGEIKVLVKHYKKKAVYRETGRVTYTFLASEDFFYWWNGEFAKIKNGNQAMKALRLTKKDIRNFIKTQGLERNLSLQEYLVRLVNLSQSAEVEFSGFAKQKGHDN